MELSFNLWASFAYPSYLNADILLDKKQYIMKVMGGAGQGILSGVTRAGQGILSWVTSDLDLYLFMVPTFFLKPNSWFSQVFFHGF